MKQTGMWRPTLTAALVMVLAGCGAYRGTWPRLAPRDASDVEFQREGLAEVPPPEVAAAGEAASPELLAQTAQERLDAIAARIQRQRIDFAGLEQRYEQQRKKVESARKEVASGRFGPSSTNWTTTQLELTRLGQIVAEMGEIRAALADIAADLATLAARQVPVSDTLAAAGGLIDRVDGRLAGADSYRREVSLSLSDAPRP